MKLSNAGRAKRYIFFLIFAILAGAGVTIVIMLNQNSSVSKMETELPTVDPEADVTIGKVHQVSSKNGVTEWVLDAISAKMVEASNRLWLEKPTAVLYLKDGSEAHLQGEEGLINTETNDVEVIGNVSLKNKEYRLATQQLQYNNKSRIVKTTLPVKISDGKSVIAADAMTYNLDTKNSHFRGNVVGIFSEDNLL
jgi:lipopolysaccharide export system protein LptC